MSLLEWFFESRNPGPEGELKISSREPDDDGDPPRKWLIYILVALGLTLTAIGLYWAFSSLPADGVKSVLSRLSALAIYLAISHFIRPVPDTTNIGWLGGLIDHPFRISDDYNRLLLLMQIILVPGKLVLYSLVMSWFIGKRLYKALRK